MNNNARMREFFDRLAPSWDNRAAEGGVRQRIVDMSAIPENSLIADIGCGRGVMFSHLLSTKPRGIIAVDISGEMLSYAKASVTDERIMYIRGDALAAFLPPLLDAVMMFNSYPHFTDKKALAEKLTAIVRPGGFVIIAHSCGRDKINVVHKGNGAVNLSVPLRPAEEEASGFAPHFIAEKAAEAGSFYFIKLKRV